MNMTQIEIPAPSFVTIDGRKMAYDEVTPENPRGTILLLTGLASKRLGWYKQLEEFGKYYRTIALDHREVGDSDPVSDFYKIEDQADDAAKVLMALGIKKAHIIGISMGGFISQQFVLRYPEMVDKLVLIATSAGGASHVAPAAEQTAALAQRDFTKEIGEVAIESYTNIMAPGYLAAHPEVQERVAFNARYRPLAALAYFRQLQACTLHDTSNRLKEIKVPTLVVHGQEDPLVPVENGLNLAEKIVGAKLLHYQNCGHIPIIEKYEDFNREVLAFLES